MGLRFRKSKKILPGVKLNVGKKSVGASFGGKAGGFSVNTKRGVTARGSIPGSGVSYTTNLTGGKEMKRSGGGGKKPLYKRPWLWVLVVLIIAGLAGMGGDKEEAAQTDEAAVTRAMPAEEAPAEPAQEEAPAEEPVQEETPAPELAPEPEPEPAPEPEPVQEAPAAAPAPAVHEYVLNTNTMKFHWPDCASVGDIASNNRQDFTGTRDEVIAKGYEPCGRCHP